MEKVSVRYISNFIPNYKIIITRNKIIIITRNT